MIKTQSPTLGNERNQALDLLRGFALLGILIMNIQSFAMPSAAYLNPTAFGNFTGINKLVWMFSHLFADQKFMTLFSMLYGAGIILVSSRAEERKGKSAGLHYKRTFWLLIIGLIHAHLIWYGDILVAYALCAFVLYPLRKVRPSRQLLLGLVLMSVHTLLYALFGLSMKQWPADALADLSVTWSPSMEKITEEISMVTGTIQEQVKHNSGTAFTLETFIFLIQIFWRASGCMLIGMALYQWGVLSAKKSLNFYRKMTFISIPTALALIIYGMIKNSEANWSMEYTMFLGFQYNYWGSLVMSLGYIGVLMLIAKSPQWQNQKTRLASVGQMALTNYISQSLICVTIFFGVGFGLFGQVERWGQVLIVLGTWVLQLSWSSYWLNRYKFGPLEWLWRSLTYGQRQPMKK